MATIYRKQELLNIVSSAVNYCGYNIIYLNNSHPFKVKIFNSTESFLVKVIIYNITHGGGRKRSSNEYRIQFKEPILEIEPGFKTLILGYYDVLSVFAGWDILKHLGTPGYSSSFQIKSQNLEQAHISGFSPCDKGNEEIAIAFKPDFLVEYVKNLESLHAFGQSYHDLAILEEVTRSESLVNSEAIEQVSGVRQQVVRTIIQKQRDNSFKSRVLRAYNYRCAFSGVQLKLVDAAHIVPVVDDRSSDETCNGIALSAIHHKAYDKGFITFNESYQIIINENQVANLHSLHLDGGIERFRAELRPIIDVPPSVSDRPHVNYIQRANRLRGWN